MQWKGKDAEIKETLEFLSWAYSEELYDCHHFIDGVLPKECIAWYYDSYYKDVT